MKKRIIVGLLTSLVVATMLVACSGAATDAGSTSSAAPASSAPQVEDTKAKVGLPTEPYYVLIIGNDSRNDTIEAKDEDDPGRADTTMLARIDPTTYQISLLTIPRDTPITENGETWKINKEYKWYGAEGYMDTIERFTGIKPKYYIDLGMAEYVNFFNEIGGVDINVPANIGFKDIMTGDYIDLTAGDQHLNGNQALVLSRVRKAFYWGDPVRQYSSRHIIENVITKDAKDPELAASDLDILLKHADTNWPKEELALQIADFCAHADKISFLEGNGPYDGAQREELNDWFCYEDPETWEAIIKVFKEGGDTTTVFPLPPLE